MRNEQLNNTCILFDKEDEAQQKAIIKFYNDGGYSESLCRLDDESYIGVFNYRLDYWFNDSVPPMQVIELPTDYYPTKIVESETPKESLAKYLLNKIDGCEKYSDFSIATDTLRCWIEEYNGFFKK